MFYRHTPPTVHSPGVFVYSLDSSTTHAQKLAVLEGICLAHYIKGMHREHSQLLLVYRQEHIHSTHKQRDALLQTYFSQVLLEWVLLTVITSYNTIQNCSRIYKWSSIMECTMIARLLILVSHCSFMSFRWEPWAVSSNGWVPHYWECFLTPSKMNAGSGKELHTLYLTSCLYNWPSHMKCSRRGSLEFWVSHGTFTISAGFKHEVFPAYEAAVMR